MSKHTPGPWEHRWIPDPSFEMTNHEWGIYSDTAAVSRIALIEGLGSEYQANARLIAAAPELLSALKEMCKRHSGCCCDEGYPPGTCPQCNARSAIDKAEGYLAQPSED